MTTEAAKSFLTGRPGEIQRDALGNTNYYWDDVLVPYGVTSFAHGELQASPVEKNKVASVLAARKVRSNREPAMGQPILILSKNAEIGGAEVTQAEVSQYSRLTISQLLAEYPSNATMVDQCLINISQLISHPSDPFLADPQNCWMLYAFNASSYSYSIEQLCAANFIKQSKENLGHTTIDTYRITTQGWARVESLKSLAPLKSEEQLTAPMNTSAPNRSQELVIGHQEKHYQIFISSTYKDLVKERQSVTTAVLELGHMPAGMELFPASSDSAWTLIKQVIDSSDYYILIIGGRYGSQDEDGIGFTEKEYDYAVSKGKPVLAFLHKDPDGLPRRDTETEDSASKKLSQFRAKVEKKHTCVYWASADELKSALLKSLSHAFKNRPAIGWIRADQVQKISHNASCDLERDRRQRAFLGFLKSFREQISRTPVNDINKLWTLYGQMVLKFRDEQGRVINDFVPEQEFDSLAETFAGLKHDDFFHYPLAGAPGKLFAILPRENARDLIATAIDNLIAFVQRQIGV